MRLRAEAPLREGPPVHWRTRALRAKPPVLQEPQRPHHKKRPFQRGAWDSWNLSFLALPLDQPAPLPTGAAPSSALALALASMMRAVSTPAETVGPGFGGPVALSDRPPAPSTFLILPSASPWTKCAGVPSDRRALFAARPAGPTPTIGARTGGAMAGASSYSSVPSSSESTRFVATRGLERGGTGGRRVA